MANFNFNFVKFNLFKYFIRECDLIDLIYCEFSGSTKANGRDSKIGLGRVFNVKLGCFDDVPVFIYADARPHL